MSYSTEQANTLYTEWYAYLQTHGQSLPAGTWLNCEAFIGLEAAILDEGRQTLDQANDNMHYYLLLIGI